MVFPSPVFLFLFLPATLLAFFVLPRAGRTPLLVVASLIFYAWGEGRLVGLLLGSILANWVLALAIGTSQGIRWRRLLLAAAVVLDMGALMYFKYTNFLVTNLNGMLGAFGHPLVAMKSVHLPLGISFVTFEALSYVIDVYRGDAAAAINPFHVAFYVSFFPHLIAGPILRFRDIAQAVERPRVTAQSFDRGVSRVSVGLAKKMLIANPLGGVADAIFAIAPGNLTTTTAWLGIVCYALQIYFDFSGYSDMAIGLGRLFGFSLPENFRAPYSATSIRDFWRRWHLTLSGWFRDYVFIPLGGSRASPARSGRNLVTVFLLCGLWHGASWNFVIWGVFHGAFLVLERGRWGTLISRAWRPFRHAYALIVVMVGWVFFRATTIAGAGAYLAAMFGKASPHGSSPAEYLTIHVEVALFVGTLAAVIPWSDSLKPHDRWRQVSTTAGFRLGVALAEVGLFVGSLLSVASGTYNPFIYFRF
jgi:alginate O-acetyltransferase complex protein AlgI